MEGFKCNVCSKMFSRADNLKQHITSLHDTVSLKKNMYSCSLCSLQSLYKRNLVRHLKRVHNIEDYEKSSTNCKQKRNTHVNDNIEKPETKKKPAIRVCKSCNLEVPIDKFSSHLRSLSHKENSCTEIEAGICLVNSAFKRNVVTYRIKDEDELESLITDISMFFSKIKEKAIKLITRALQENPLKINFELFASYANSTKQDNDEEACMKNEVKSFNSKYEIVTSSSDLDELYSHFYGVLKNKSEEFEMQDSNWQLISLLYLEINLLRYNPLHAGSFIALPSDIEARKAIINVKNFDQMCFKWSCLSALHPAGSNPDRVSNYEPYSNELNFIGIPFPVAMKDIPKFEKQNQHISINVFGLEKNHMSGKITYNVIGPLYHTKDRKENHINLLYLEADSGRDGHFCWIKNMSRLISRQLNKHDHAVFICDGCLVFFNKECDLKEHLRRGDCAKVYTILPKQGEHYLEFKDFYRSFAVPFTIYSDFETVLKPIEGCELNPEKKYVVNSQIHEAHSFAYYVKCDFDNSLSFLRQYRGKDCTSTYIKWLTDDVKQIYKQYFSKTVPMKPLTAEELGRHESSTVCFICRQPFLTTVNERVINTFCHKDEQFSMIKVRDHDHFTGLYRGPAHMKCNLNYKTPNFIPIFLHNASSYDLHLLVQELAAQLKSLDVIALNKEKYISLSAKIYVNDNLSDSEDVSSEEDDEGIMNDEERKKDRKKYISLRFLDSYRFMASSLEALANNLETHQFVETRKAFPSDELFDLVRRKGIFPYEFIDSYEKLEATRELPSREHFYSSLTETNVDEADYEHARKVWIAFDCKNLAQYSDLYLKTDVLLLTDIFEAFRKVCMNLYDLDPCWFFTLPALSWSAMLKYTEVKLELLTDVDMLHFIRKSIRGGIVQCSQRHAVANNRYMPERDEDDCLSYLSYKPAEETSYLIYLDANNLYGVALSNYLPHSGFNWLSAQEIEQFDVMLHCSNPISETGYILEVDLEYPRELHDLHDELPFCPENIRPPVEGHRQVKLIPNLFNKNNYVIHYRNLYQAVKHGLRVTKIHRILSFQQSDWLKKYIDLNTKKRQEAKNEFEKNSYKLANNAIFGKCMEAVDKRVTVKLVTKWKDYRRSRGAETLISLPNFHSISVFNENFVAIQLKQMKVNFNKPIYVGFSVLDISKTVMYSFHYDFVKKTYGNENAKLLYTDTDSLIYSIKTQDVYADIKKNINKFDTSNYDINNPYEIPLVNKAVLGVFKDENAGNVMLEFVGLRAKLYDFVVGKSGVVKKAKGVKKCVTKRLKHEAYRNCLFNRKALLCKQSIFRSIKHVIHTQVINKVALSYQDDKRFILPDGIHTLAWGNYKIKNI